MKKTRFLALVLVIAIALMGAGYAAWTDYTQLDTTVTTGKMDVNVRWANVTKPQFANATIEGGLNAGQDPNKITVNVTDLYPTKYKANGEGASDTFVRIHFAVENHGTVPVKLDNIEFTRTNEDSKVWDAVKTVIHMHQGKINGPNGTSTPIDIRSLTGTNPIGMFQDKFLKDLDTLLMNSGLATTTLMPGETIWFGGATEDESSIRFWLDEKLADNDLQNESFGFTLKFNWKQANLE